MHANSLARILLIATTLLMVSSPHAAEQLYTYQPTVTPQLAHNGAFTPGVMTLEVSNPGQRSATDFTSMEDRPLTLEIWYPAVAQDDAKRASYRDVTRSHAEFELLGMALRDAPAMDNDESFPLIVLSHGYTGYRSIMFYLGEHLASHGYVVVAIDHTDSTNADVDFTTNPFSGFMSTLIHRARDQQFVLDYMSKLDSPLGRITDTDKAAVVGYSMGGYGALNTVGGCYAFTTEGLQAFGIPAAQAQLLVPVFNSCNGGRATVDPRWRAMVAISPWGGEQGVHDATSLANLKVPTMFVGGDQDDISGYERGIKRLHEQTGSPHNYLLVYRNARHNIAPHPSPSVAYDNDLDIGHYFEPSWDMETINRINEHMSLAFLDCFVKSRKSACEFLPAREDITQVKDAEGKMSAPWPGFKDRWGTGVSFYRKGTGATEE